MRGTDARARTAALALSPRRAGQLDDTADGARPAHRQFFFAFLQTYIILLVHRHGSTSPSMQQDLVTGGSRQFSTLIIFQNYLTT